MKKASFSVDSKQTSPALTWKQWNDYLASFGVHGKLMAPEDVSVRARASSFIDDQFHINFFERETLTHSTGIASIVERTAADIHDPSAKPLTLLYVGAGSFLVQQRGRTFSVGQGSALLLNEQDPFTLTTYQGLLKITAIKIAEETLENFLPKEIDRETRLISHEHPWGRVFLSMAAHLSPEQMNCLPTARTALGDALYCMLSLSIAPEKELSGFDKNSLMRAIRKHIRESYTDSALSPESVAQRMNLPCQTVLDVMRTSGVAFYQALNNERVHQAKRLLASNHLNGKNISEIAYQVGFINAAHFSFVFKKAVGLTPRHFRTFCRTAGGNGS